MKITLGEFLQKARLEKGINLSEAAYQTRIREHYLNALENNQVEKLPSKTQAKGYLRIYAEFLSLDQKNIINAFEHPDKLVFEEKPVEKLEDLTERTDESSFEPAEEEIQKHEILDEEVPAPEEEKIFHGNGEVVSVSQPEKNQPQSIGAIQQEKIQLKSISQQIFISIGEKLQDRRRQLNLSTEEIEQFTSIRPHYLKALEDGTIEKLPSIPQARGMLNNYATFLNLDVDNIMIQFAEGLQTKRNESYAPHKIGSDNQLAYQTPEIKKVGWFKFITTDLIMTSGLIIGLFIFILWGAANISGVQEPENEIEPPSISEILLENTPEIQVTPLATEISAQVTETVTTVNEGEIQEEDSEIQDGPQISGFPVQVYIIARQRAYLKVDVDGETVFTGRTVPGNAYEFSGSTSVELLTGNAAALEIYYNLSPVGVIGEVGEVKSVVFTTSTGLVTPTPRFTPTPTNTLQPSPTLQPTQTPTVPPPTITPTVTQLIP